MPVSDESRWRGWSTGLAELPQPVTIRCARCGFATEGELEQARRAFAEHECATGRVAVPATDRETSLELLCSRGHRLEK